MDVITNPDDPRLAPFTATRQPDRLLHEGLFVVESRRAVERLIDARRHAVQSVLVSPTAAAAMGPTAAKLPSDVPVFVAAQEIITATAGFNVHRGCLALARRPPNPAPATVTAHARLVLVLEAVSDPENVGAIFRSAAALGAGGVLLGPGCADPLYRRSIRSSAAATLTMNFSSGVAWQDARRLLVDDGFAIVALAPRGAVELKEAARTLTGRKVALLLGGEGDGLRPDTITTADYRVRIAMTPGVDSLNVAAAAAIALSHFGAQTWAAYCET